MNIFSATLKKYDLFFFFTLKGLHNHSPGLSERERTQAWVKVEIKFEALKGRDRK